MTLLTEKAGGSLKALLFVTDLHSGPLGETVSLILKILHSGFISHCVLDLKIQALAVRVLTNCQTDRRRERNGAE